MSLLPSRRTVLSALAAILPIHPVLADYASRAEEAELPFFEELPTVLSASRLPQVLNEAPGAITILDREFIRATGYRDIARLLRLVPGMQIGQERGNAQWVTYHGLSGDTPTEIQVLIDGRSINLFAGINWTGLPITIEEIERIEVIRGTNSNAYGSNAFLGVINIITRHSQQTQGATGQANAGSRGIADLQASWSGSSDGLGVRLSALQARDNGFSGLHDSRLSQTLSLRSDYRLDAHNELTLRAGHNYIERGVGYGDSIFNNNGERTLRNDTSTLHLSWRRTVDDEEWLASLYYTYESGTERWLANGPGYAAVPLNRDHHGQNTSAEIQHRFALNAQTRLVWGLEGRWEIGQAQFLFPDGQPADRQSRAFTNLDWRITPTWQLNLGGLLEKNAGSAAQLIPRAFINWRASASDTFRAGYARAWQRRQLFNTYGDVRVYDPSSGRLIAWPYLPNPELRRMRIDSFEIGYLGRFHAIDSTLDVRIFNERISDFVVRQTVPLPAGQPPLPLPLPTTQFVNLSDPVVLRGIEYQFKAKPRPGSEIIFNHTLFSRPHENDPQLAAARSAPYIASLSWLQNYGWGWTSTASLLRMGPQAGGYGYVPGSAYSVRAYTTLDLRIARSFMLDRRKTEIALNGINLGPRHQEIADRSEQAMHPYNPINRTSSMVWLSLAVEL